tara:strand:- start:7 stop:243 length:237 start_codon:yes stop_codon:yes gene_type:complete
MLARVGGFVCSIYFGYVSPQKGSASKSKDDLPSATRDNLSSPERDATRAARTEANDYVPADGTAHESPRNPRCGGEQE